MDGPSTNSNGGMVCSTYHTILYTASRNSLWNEQYNTSMSTIWYDGSKCKKREIKNGTFHFPSNITEQQATLYYENQKVVDIFRSSSSSESSLRPDSIHYLCDISDTLCGANFFPFRPFRPLCFGVSCRLIWQHK